MMKKTEIKPIQEGNEPVRMEAFQQFVEMVDERFDEVDEKFERVDERFDQLPSLIREELMRALDPFLIKLQNVRVEQIALHHQMEDRTDRIEKLETLHAHELGLAG